MDLSSAQREQIGTMFEAMKAETIPLGEQLIGLEIDLDREFASKSITRVSLKNTTDRIGTRQGNLWAAHLKYHLMTLDILSEQQAAHYAELRGYGEPGPTHRHHQ
ncbi:MAG: hypothetical protein ACREMY_05980 [bacterium]